MVLYDEVDEVTWWEKQLGDWGSNFVEHNEGIISDAGENRTGRVSSPGVSH